MAKFLTPLKIAITSGAIGMAGAGVGGYQTGKRSGAQKMGRAMASEFTRLNEIENQHIARSSFLAGLSHKKGKTMNKQAMLEEIYNESFNDELEKIAGVGSTINKVPGHVWNIIKRIGGAYKKSGKDLYAGAKESSTKMIEAMRKNPQHRWNKSPRLAAQALRGEAGKSAVKGLKGGALALGTAGGVGLGAGGASMMSKRD